MEEDKMAETCKSNDRNKKCIQNFEENSLFGRSRLRWDDNFKEGCSSNRVFACGVESSGSRQRKLQGKKKHTFHSISTKILYI